MHIPILPKMYLHGNKASFYDGDQATLLELASTLHGTMNNVIEEYNAFVDGVNEKITEFVNGSETDYETFKTALRQEFQDFIDVITLKYEEQESLINNIREFIQSTAEAILAEHIENGTLKGTDEEARAAIEEHKNDKSNPHGVTAAQVGARPNTWTPNAEEVGAEPTKYFNGKIVHRVEIDLGLMPNKTSKNVEHGIQNLSDIVSCYGRMTYDGFKVSIPYYESTTNMVGLNCQKYNVSIITGHDASLWSGRVIVEYTKTT